MRRVGGRASALTDPADGHAGSERAGPRRSGLLPRRDLRDVAPPTVTRSLRRRTRIPARGPRQEGPRLAGEKKGFGAIAKRWLEAKKTELLTTNNRQRENARYEEEQSEKAMREKVGEEAVLGLFPGLRKFQDNQEKARADAEARRIDEQRALPIALVSLTFSGEVNGSWSGECHVEPGAGDGVASIGLVVIPGEWPIVGGAPFGGWNFLIPGFDGPRTYDLVAIGEALEASGNDLDYVDFRSPARL